MKDFWNKTFKQNSTDTLCNTTHNNWLNSEPLTFDKIHDSLKSLTIVPDYICSIYCPKDVICKVENSYYLHPNSLKKLEQEGLCFTLETKYSTYSGRYTISDYLKPSVELPPYK